MPPKGARGLSASELELVLSNDELDEFFRAAGKQCLDYDANGIMKKAKLDVDKLAHQHTFLGISARLQCEKMTKKQAVCAISFFAKKARGAMARFAIDERVERVEDLKAFDRDGYRFDKAASTDNEWIFIRSGNS